MTTTKTTKRDKTKANQENRLRKSATRSHGLDRTRIIIIIIYCHGVNTFIMQPNKPNLRAHLQCCRRSTLV